MEQNLTIKLLYLWNERLEESLKYDNPTTLRLHKLAQATSDWESASRNDDNYLVHKSRPLHLCILSDEKLISKSGFAAIAHRLSMSSILGAAGELLADVSLGELTKMEAADFFPELEQCQSFPSPFFSLQCTPHGTPLGYNQNGVYMLDCNLEFHCIGNTNNFLDYCINQTLDGEEWFYAFRGKKDVKKYELDWIDPWAD